MSPVELLVIQRDIVVHVSLSVVSEDLVFTKTLQKDDIIERNIMYPTHIAYLPTCLKPKVGQNLRKSETFGPKLGHS